MATETTDYASVLNFINRAKIQDCFIRTPEVPDRISAEETLPHLIPYLDLGLRADDGLEQPGALYSEQIQAFATGWTEMEGVMLLTPEPEFDADLRVTIAASNERALRDLLLSFPSGKVGLFYFAAEWMLPAFNEILDGCVMPAREGYYATEHTISPLRDFPSRKLQQSDYSLVQAQWSESVWRELCEGGYSVHACHVESELSALCFHWTVESWRNEVHGLQAVKDYSRPFAESVITSATEEVLQMGKVATCTANLSNNKDYLRAFREVGYCPFYRVGSFLGIKRGSGKSPEPIRSDFYTGSGPRAQSALSGPLGEGRRINGGKDPIVVQASELTHAAGRRERSQFLVEGVTLVQRAIQDGLPVDNVLYTHELLSVPEGAALLASARQANIDHYSITEGLIGKVTTTRPIPLVLAAVYAHKRSMERFQLTEQTALLVVENVNNPDNLGMILRTADAAGVGGVIVVGEKSDPFHKNCVRAARGAVGRFPILTCPFLEQVLQGLQRSGFTVAGAALDADHELYQCALPLPIAIIVGNEQAGISRATLDACTMRVRIPMAAGQDSLNVGVAAGLLLYEVFRQKTMSRLNAPILP